MSLGGRWEPSSFDVRAAQRSRWMSRATGRSPVKNINVVGDPRRLAQAGVGALKFGKLSLSLNPPAQGGGQEPRTYGGPKMRGEPPMGGVGKKGRFGKIFTPTQYGLGKGMPVDQEFWRRQKLNI